MTRIAIVLVALLGLSTANGQNAPAGPRESLYDSLLREDEALQARRDSLLYPDPDQRRRVQVARTRAAAAALERHQARERARLRRERVTTTVLSTVGVLLAAIAVTTLRTRERRQRLVAGAGRGYAWAHRRQARLVAVAYLIGACVYTATELQHHAEVPLGVGVLLAPLTVVVGPWYVLIAGGPLLPLVLTYGAFAVWWVVGQLASARRGGGPPSPTETP